jgi:predicted MFS family arabinose efflux permease
MTYATWKERKDKGFIDVVNLVLGAVLFLGPWLYGFADLQQAVWNAWITGIVMIGLAAAIFAFAEWEEWVNLVVAALSAAGGWYFHQNPPQATA